MKLGRETENTILLMVAILALTVIGAYLIAGLLFNWSVSNDPQSWGPTGDYFGGILNPVIALAALVALIRATKLQKAEFESTRLHLETESQKNEIYRLVTNLEQKIERKLEVEVKNDRTNPAITFGSLSQYLRPGWRPPPKTYISLGNSNLCTEIKDYSRELLQLFDMLDKLLKEYDSVSGETTTVSMFLTDVYSCAKEACREQVDGQNKVS